MTSEGSVEWNKTEILCLIKLIGEPFVNNHGEYSNDIFIEAATKLFQNGFQKTYIQCKIKWKELINEYKEFRKEQMGNEPQFYVELDRILTKLPQFSENYRQWTEPETLSLINIIKEGHYILEIQRNSNDITFERLTKELENSGYKLRKKDEVILRWQRLKSLYKSYIKGEVLNFKYFDVMDKLLDWNSNNLDDDDLQENITYDSEDFEVKSKEVKKKSNNWSHKETLILLKVIKDFNYPKIKRSQKNDMFDKASLQLRTEGFKRSNEQCRLKFKHLKAKYFRALKKQKEFNINPEHFCPHFYNLHEIMSESKTEEMYDEENYEIEYLDDYKNEILEKIYLNDPDTKVERAIWTTQETKHFLEILKTENIKRFNRKSFFEDVSNELLKLGYHKSPNTCIIKWKNLRRQYKESIKNDTYKNSEICQYFEEINEIIKNFENTEEELFNSLQNGEEIDFEDNSNDSLSRDIDLDSNTDLKRSNDDDSLTESKRLKISKINDERLVCNYKMDDIQHYCMSLTETFKRLPNIKQAKLKIEIQKLLFRAEFDDNF